MANDSFMEDAEIVRKIQELKRERKAVILSHFYERPEVQDVADHVGDSLELSRIAAKTDADVIVFCSVRFMAETAKILSPQKIVLLPVAEAGCPLSDTITPAQLMEAKARHPHAAVVAYVNCSAEIKALSHYCCTSANALQVVESVPEKEILFVPDGNLGRWVQKHSRKNIILWEGCCPTHQNLKLKDVLDAKARYPDAEVVVHPECPEEICDVADAVMSTAQMIRYCQASSKKTFIIGTEMGLMHRLRKLMPEKTFIQASKTLLCPNMKLTQLEDVYTALKEMKHVIEVPEDIRVKAHQALDAMMSMIPSK
jgi:quinolinate synthase